MRFLLLFMLVLVLSTSCRTSRKISTAMAKKDSITVVVPSQLSDSSRLVTEALEKISQQHINYTTFASKVKVDYEDSRNQRYDFNANLRMYKDSLIWISINAVLGIEAFRVLITPDSVMILDKINRTVQVHPLSYLQEIANLPIDFSTLQDLIIGNPVYLDRNIIAYRESGEYILMSSAGAFFKHLLTFYKNDFLLRHSKLDDVDVSRNRTADLSYDGYENNNGLKPFSTRRSITIAEKNKLGIDLEFKQVQFNEPVNFPFAIPKNYKLK